MLDYSRLWIQKITHIKTLYLKHFVKKGVISIYRGSLPYVNFITSNAKLFKYLAKYFITYCNFHNWPNIKKKRIIEIIRPKKLFSQKQKLH